MIQHTHKQAGFTLIEVILVMSIMVMTVPLVYQKASSLQEHQTIKSFEQEIENLLYFAQLSALAEEKMVTVHFDTQNQGVDVYTDLFHKLYWLPFPKGMTVERATHSLIINFNNKGSVDQAGSIVVRSAHYAYQITFLLGQGRFYAEAI